MEWRGASERWSSVTTMARLVSSDPTAAFNCCQRHRKPTTVQVCFSKCVCVCVQRGRESLVSQFSALIGVNECRPVAQLKLSITPLRVNGDTARNVTSSHVLVSRPQTQNMSQSLSSRSACPPIETPSSVEEDVIQRDASSQILPLSTGLLPAANLIE